MSVRVIFAPLTGRKSDKSVLATAAGTAKRFNAHIDIVSVRADPRDAIPYLGEGLSGALVEELIERAETKAGDRTRKARVGFDAWRDATGLVYADSRSDFVTARPTDDDGPSCSWREISGASNQTVATCGRLADLIVAPRGDLESDVEDEVALETALFHSGRPLLLAPPAPASEFGDRIAVAWDGSAEAARAVGAALPFLQRAETVTALSVEEEGKPEAPGAELAKYLAWHGVQLNTLSIPLGTVTVGEAILGAAMRESADMLVMGAYSHNRFRELVFGGTT